MTFTLSSISSLLIELVAFVVALVVHESAHALVAFALGDSTARRQGRVSLNPLSHIDPFGTLILPLLMLAAGGPIFAFAKPVPVYLHNLKHPTRDEVLVALAGPASNALLAAVSAFILHGAVSAFGNVSLLAGTSSALGIILSFLVTSIYVNLSLCFFNLIPLPPLDGSSVLVPFLHGPAREIYYECQRYAMPILIVVLYLLPQFLHIDLISLYFNYTVYPLADLLLSSALGLSGLSLR